MRLPKGLNIFFWQSLGSVRRAPAYVRVINARLVRPNHGRKPESDTKKVCHIYRSPNKKKPRAQPRHWLIRQQICHASNDTSLATSVNLTFLSRHLSRLISRRHSNIINNERESATSSSPMSDIVPRLTPREPKQSCHISCLMSKGNKACMHKNSH